MFKPPMENKAGPAAPPPKGNPAPAKPAPAKKGK